jgi:hypothetical protein
VQVDRGVHRMKLVDAERSRGRRWRWRCWFWRRVWRLFRGAWCGLVGEGMGWSSKAWIGGRRQWYGEAWVGEKAMISTNQENPVTVRLSHIHALSLGPLTSIQTPVLYYPLSPYFYRHLSYTIHYTSPSSPSPSPSPAAIPEWSRSIKQISRPAKSPERT